MNEVLETAGQQSRRATALQRVLLHCRLQRPVHSPQHELLRGSRVQQTSHREGIRSARHVQRSDARYVRSGLEKVQRRLQVEQWNIRRSLAEDRRGYRRLLHRTGLGCPQQRVSYGHRVGLALYVA
jgi:hypothetical protein